MAYSEHYNSRRHPSDDFGQRREPVPTSWRQRDDSRDRARGTNRIYDRDRDWERDRDRDRPPDRQRERDWASREWGHGSDRGLERERDRPALDRDDPKPPPDEPTKDKPPGNGGGRISSNFLPNKPLNPARPETENRQTMIPDTQRADAAQSKPAQSASSSQPGPKARPTSQAGTHTLISILQRCRQLGELEHDKSALEAQSKRQKAEAKMSLQRDSEYPVIPEILKHAQQADISRLQEVTDRAQKVKETLAHLCDKLLAEIRLRPDHKSISLMEAVGKKQEHLAHELEALRDLSRTTTSEQKKDKTQLKEDNAVLKETNVQLQGEVASLKQEVASSREGMAKLTKLVTTLMSKVDGIDTATTNVSAEVRKLDARATQHSSQADAMAEKMQGYDNVLAAIDPTSLEQTTAFIALEKADMAKDVREQKTTVSELRSRVESLQASIEASNVLVARAAAPAPVPAPAAFPGDDFISVRFEIGKLGERLAKLEPLPRIVSALSDSHQQAVMDQRSNTQKLLKANGSLSDVFGQLLKQETAARRKDLERVLSLEQMVSRLGSSAATAAKTAPVEEEEKPRPRATAGISKPPSPQDAGTSGGGAEEGTIIDTASSASASAPRPVAEASEVLADLRALQDKLTALEDSVKKTGIDVGEKYTQLRMMIATLDNQFSNLTTKDLFVAIMGQVERLYPNTRQLQQDIAAVADKLRKLEQVSSRVEAITPQKRMPISNTNGNARGQPADTLTSKRRRLNSGTAAENE